MSTTSERAAPSAHTHARAAELFRRPFAPGAIGFRAMMKVPLNGDPFGGAQVAAYIGAQSVIQRLNAVVPGRWRQEFRPIDPPPGSKRIYLACRLIVTLAAEEGGPEVEAVYEDVGELDPGSRAGLKALYSDARKRAAVAAGIGAYLYTALEPVVLGQEARIAGRLVGLSQERIHGFVPFDAPFTGRPGNDRARPQRRSPAGAA